MSLFCFQKNIIDEKCEMLKISYTRYCDIYENIRSQLSDFDTELCSESEESDGIRNNFNIILKVLERDIYNLEMLIEALQSISETVTYYDSRVFEKSEEEVPEITEWIDGTVFQEENDDDWQDSLEENQENYNSFAEYSATRMGSAAAEADDIISSVFDADEQENMMENAAEVQDSENISENEEKLNLFSNADFMNGVLSVAGNSMKDSRSIIISLLLGGLTSLLTGFGTKKLGKGIIKPQI